VLTNENKINKEILNHYLVPKHIILSEQEKKELLDKFDIVPEQLPKISVNDPVVKVIGAQAGDILKIVRKSPTAGEAVYYRLVVEKVG
jgi:DNA-directed RNA polymerase subunit H